MSLVLTEKDVVDIIKRYRASVPAGTGVPVGITSVDGRHGPSVTLSDLYSAITHNHDSVYAPLAHGVSDSYIPAANGSNAWRNSVLRRDDATSITVVSDSAVKFRDANIYMRSTAVGSLEISAYNPTDNSDTVMTFSAGGSWQNSPSHSGKFLFNVGMGACGGGAVATAMSIEGDSNYNDSIVSIRGRLYVWPLTLGGMLKTHPTTGYMVSAVAGTDYEPPIVAGTSLQYWTGAKAWATLNTAAVPESGNLYFTTARSRGAISASDPVTYNNSTGAIAFSYNATNMKITTNALNTIQDIATGSSPTFNGLTVSGLTISSSGTGIPYFSANAYSSIISNGSGWLKNNGSGGFSWSTPTYSDVGAIPASGGTTNRLTYWASSSTIGASGIEISGTKYGVNVTPLSCFHIRGDSATDTVKAQLIIDSTESYDTYPTSGIFFRNKFNSYNGGEYTPSGAIVAGKENTTYGYNEGYLAFYIHGAGGSLTHAMRINSAGNVGVGTASPFGNLCVAQTTGTPAFYVGKDGQNFLGLTYNTSTGLSNIHSYYGNAVSNLAILPNGGNVGIGFDAPTSTLHAVNSQISKWTTSFANSRTSGHNFNFGYNNDTTRYGLAISGGGGNLNSYSIIAHDPTFCVRDDNKVGVGTLTPETLLDVHATAAVPVLSLTRSNGSGSTDVAAGNDLGYLAWYGLGSGSPRNAAYINVDVIGTPINDTVAGRMLFATCPAGVSQTPLIRMSIDQNGHVDLKKSYGTGYIEATVSNGYSLTPTSSVIVINATNTGDDGVLATAGVPDGFIVTVCQGSSYPMIFGQQLQGGRSAITYQLQSGSWRPIGSCEL